MVTISLLLLSVGALAGVITAGIWAIKLVHGLTPSDIA